PRRQPRLRQLLREGARPQLLIQNVNTARAADRLRPGSRRPIHHSQFTIFNFHRSSMAPKKKTKAYAQAGVNIALGDRMKSGLKESLKSASRPEVLGAVGG